MAEWKNCKRSTSFILWRQNERLMLIRETAARFVFSIKRATYWNWYKIVQKMINYLIEKCHYVIMATISYIIVNNWNISYLFQSYSCLDWIYELIILLLKMKPKKHHAYWKTLKIIKVCLSFWKYIHLLRQHPKIATLRSICNVIKSFVERKAGTKYR